MQYSLSLQNSLNNLSRKQHFLQEEEEEEEGGKKEIDRWEWKDQHVSGTVPKTQRKQNNHVYVASIVIL